MWQRKDYVNIERCTYLLRKLCFNIFLAAMVFINLPALAQEKHLVQIKTFDQQLQVMKNVEVSINGKDFISVGNKGTAFIELNENDLPIRNIKIKNEQLEPASWNNSKGVVEIIIRKKSYHVAHLLLQDVSKKPIAFSKVVFKGNKTVSATTDVSGKFEVPLGLDEKIISADQFTIQDYKVTGLLLSEQESILTIDPIKNEKVNQTPITNREYFKDFDLSKIDSIQSLTVFWAIFKNYSEKDLSPEAKRRVDAKFAQLLGRLQDSALQKKNPFMGKISDSSFVSDDLKNLLSKATLESQTLQEQRLDFDDKINIINNKLAAGVINLDPQTRSKLLNDLNLLERLLSQNESRFFKNQNDYRQIINSLKEKFFDVENLENKLSESEAQRMEEQRVFQQRLLAISGVVAVFAIFIILLVYFSNELRKQRKKLLEANEKINRINDDLEIIVLERTQSLEEAHKELDTFLYRASHDLRSPVCSIIGLCNIAMHLSPKEFIERVENITVGMDKLLKKLSMISEINEPTNYSSVTMRQVVENVKHKFNYLIKGEGIQFHIDCPTDVVFHSYPNLIEGIVSNLLENALFFSMVRNPEHSRVEFKAEVKGNAVEFSVYDNGIGVENVIRDRLFDMFFKGHERSKGNGLGLYIVQKSVHALEGRIKMESEPGHYSKFIVQLPLKMVAV
jgi:signal transduction histidine kinase